MLHCCANQNNIIILIFFHDFVMNLIIAGATHFNQQELVFSTVLWWGIPSIITAIFNYNTFHFSLLHKPQLLPGCLTVTRPVVFSLGAWNPDRFLFTFSEHPVSKTSKAVDPEGIRNYPNVNRASHTCLFPSLLTCATSAFPRTPLVWIRKFPCECMYMPTFIAVDMK